MAMKIGSKYKFSEIESRHWDQFAESAGLAKAHFGIGTVAAVDCSKTCLRFRAGIFW
jgi:hypothetical protein